MAIENLKTPKNLELIPKIYNECLVAATIIGISIFVNIKLKEPNFFGQFEIKNPENAKERSEDLSKTKCNTSWDNKKLSGIPKITNSYLANIEIAKMIGSDKFTTLIGGLPLFCIDQIQIFIGAFGISGGTEMQDLAIGLFVLAKNNLAIKKEWIEELQTLSADDQLELWENCQKLGIGNILHLED
jgi:Haem-degrading